MTKETIQKQFVAFVCRNFLVDEEDIILDESLVDQGVIDSFGLVEIAAYIGSTYAYKVPQEEMNRANFGSVLKIVDFIIRKAGGIQNA